MKPNKNDEYSQHDTLLVLAMILAGLVAALCVSGARYDTLETETQTKKCVPGNYDIDTDYVPPIGNAGN